jgi:ribose 5-phosphate isomerase B
MARRVDPFKMLGISHARQGVEDDNMNVLCMGGRVIGLSSAWDILEAFLAAEFSNAERHRRRLAKIAAFEMESAGKNLAR